MSEVCDESNREDIIIPSATVIVVDSY